MTPPTTRFALRLLPPIVAVALLTPATSARFAGGVAGSQEQVPAQETGTGVEAPSGPSLEPPLVVAAEVDGIIHPVSAEFMIATMEQADARDAALTVFTLRTPGGLVDSTRAIITSLIAAETPVAVFVGPSGARAASAGFLLTLSADVAAMAPGTSIGAAHPVSGDGQEMNETVAEKAASDVAAYARSLATGRRRNVELAELAVTESRAFTAGEALEAEPPLIDLVVQDVDALLTELDGRTIVRFDGSEVTLRTAGARIEPVEMNWRQRILSAIAHPQVAYLLFSLGSLGLVVELWSPGAILPGVAGGLCLLLAFFAFQILPVNYAGLLLILFGTILLILEIKVASFGLLATGGIISLLFGSLMLFESPVPELRVTLPFVLPLVLAFAGITLFLVRLAVNAQMRQPVTGTSGMLGEQGRALGPIAPGGRGQVSTHGEIWNATSTVAVSDGALIEVVGVDGLVLTVRPLAGAVQEGRDR